MSHTDYFSSKDNFSKRFSNDVIRRLYESKGYETHFIDDVKEQMEMKCDRSLTDKNGRTIYIEEKIIDCTIEKNKIKNVCFEVFQTCTPRMKTKGYIFAESRANLFLYVHVMNRYSLLYQEDWSLLQKWFIDTFFSYDELNALYTKQGEYGVSERVRTVSNGKAFVYHNRQNPNIPNSSSSLNVLVDVKWLRKNNIFSNKLFINSETLEQIT